MKNILLILVLFESIFATTFAQNPDVHRTMYTLHGLGGSVATWQRASTAVCSGLDGQGNTIPNWSKINAINFFPLQYEKISSTIDDASSNIVHQFQLGDQAWGPSSNFQGVRANSFVISHSLGGLVARAYDRNKNINNNFMSGYFGGIVTVASPHAGSPLINNHDQYGPFISSACTALSTGPVDELISDKWYLRLLGVDRIAIEAVNLICSFTPNIALLTVFKDQSANIANDFKVGATALQNLTNFDNSRVTGNGTNQYPPLVKVQCYGTIDNNTSLWNLLESTAISDPSNALAFQANTHGEQVIKDIGDITNNYQAKANQFSSYARAVTNAGFSSYCNWGQWIFQYQYCILNDQKINDRSRYERYARDYQAGANWLNTANEQYNTITGAVSFQYIDVPANTCTCYRLDYFGNLIQDGSYDVQVSGNDPYPCDALSSLFQTCNQTGTNTGTITSLQRVEKASDGAVLAESATAYPGCSLVNTIQMVNSNHSQITNDANTKAVLLKMFNDTKFANGFFNAR